MKKHELDKRVDVTIAETHDALQTMYDALPQGQKMQLARNEQVRAILDRYGVEVVE